MQNQVQGKKQGKKLSLFKQKIKQAKPDPSAQQSFPVAVKIDLPQQPAYDGHKNQLSQAEQKRFSQRLMQSMLNTNQIQQINQQNMKMISQMSMQQISKYQEMIVKQLPEGFVKKLNPNKSFNQKQLNNQVQQVPNQQDHGTKLPTDQTSHTIQEQSHSQIDMPKNEGSLGSLDNLVFNIIKNEVIFFPSDLDLILSKEEFLKIKTLKQMIESENNQTQVVASQLTRKLCHYLFSAGDEYKRFIPLVIISGQPFHLSILCQDIHKWLIKSVLHQVRRTNFKTCWMQLLECLEQCVKLMIRWTRNGKEGQKHLRQIKQSIQKQLSRRQQFLQSQNNNKPNLGQKLQKLVLEIEENKMINQVSCQKWVSLSCFYPNQILDLILVQQFAPPVLIQTLLTKISRLCTNYYQPHSIAYFSFLLDFTYPLVLCLQSRNMRFNRVKKEISQEKQLIYTWFSYQMGSPPLSLVLSPHTTLLFSEQFCFKCLHITKIMNEKQYEEFVNLYLRQSKGKRNKESLIYQLILLNLDEYFHECQNEEQHLSQIETINSMIRYVDECIKKQSHYLKEIAPEIFLLILSIFQTSYKLSTVESQTKYLITFESLNQQNLQQLFNSLCRQIIRRQKTQHLWSMIPEERVKSIIDSYNFNSYGNYCFSKAILFLLATCPNKNTSNLFVEQLLSRYPFLFYHSASKGLFGGENIYLNGVTKLELQAIYEIIKINPKISGDNIFIKFLRRQ